MHGIAPDLIIADQIIACVNTTLGTMRASSTHFDVKLFPRDSEGCLVTEEWTENVPEIHLPGFETIV